MILEVFFKMLSGLLDWLVSMRPAWSMQLPAPISGLISTVRTWDNFVPATEALLCVSILGTLVAVMQGFKWLIKLVDWIADVIP